MLWWVRPLLVRLLVMLNAIQNTQERFHLDNNNNNQSNYSMFSSSSSSSSELAPRAIVIVIDSFVGEREIAVFYLSPLLPAASAPKRFASFVFFVRAELCSAAFLRQRRRKWH